MVSIAHRPGDGKTPPASLDPEPGAPGGSKKAASNMSEPRRTFGHRNWPPPPLPPVPLPFLARFPPLAGSPAGSAGLAGSAALAGGAGSTSLVSKISKDGPSCDYELQT